MAYPRKGPYIVRWRKGPVTLAYALAAAGTAVMLAAVGGLWPAPAPSDAHTPSGLHGKQFKRVAALGDSITLGVNACGRAGECRTASWSTGADGGTGGFAARLGEATGHPPETANLAVGGARAKDLRGQAAAAAADGADLVTVLVGGNDACAPTQAGMTPTSEYAAAVKDALATLEAAPSHPVVFVASVPYLNGLLTAYANNPAATRLWQGKHLCQSLLAQPDSSDPARVSGRAAVAARVNEYNTALAEQCAAVSRCIFDGRAVATMDFTAAQISTVDYFHPSREGQLAIAGATWAALADALDHCELPTALRAEFGC
jgi:lysophospholipase L1-like esterase